MRGSLLATVIACAPSPLHADGVADEVSAGTTMQLPNSSWIANRITGTWDIDDALTMQVDLAVTRTSSTSTTGALSLAYSPDDHWSLGVAAGLVPTATTTSRTALALDEVDGGVTLADAELTATSSSTSLAVSVGYDTAGDSDHETSLSLSLGVAHHQSQQTFASILDPDGHPLAADDVRQRCMTRPCNPEIMAALSPLWSQLSQFSISAGVIQTESKTVDLGLDATYYLYDADPAVAGRFRLPGGSGPSDLGNGIGVTPLRYVVSPTLGTRWKNLQGTLALAYGSQIADRGYELGATIKVTYKRALERDTAMRLYSSVGISWGVDALVELTTSLAISLGGKYTW